MSIKLTQTGHTGSNKSPESAYLRFSTSSKRKKKVKVIYQTMTRLNYIKSTQQQFSVGLVVAAVVVDHGDHSFNFYKRFDPISLQSFLKFNKNKRQFSTI